MKLTRTNKNFTRLNHGLCGPKELSTRGMFKGVIQPLFMASNIRDRQPQSSGSFRGVAKDFHKQKSPVLQFLSPVPRGGENTYTFSPTIRLNYFSGPANTTLFRVAGAHLFQTITGGAGPGRAPETSRAPETVRALENSQAAGDRGTKNFWTMVEGRPVTKVVESRRFGGRASSGTGFAGSLLGRGLPRHVDGRLWTSEVLSQLVPALVTTVKGITPGIASITNLLNSGPRSGESLSLRHSSRAPEPNAIFAALRKSMQPVSFDRLRIQHRLVGPLLKKEDDNTLQSYLNVTREILSDSRFSKSFTTVTLNFAAPKVAQAELVNKRPAQFIDLPSMTYVKSPQNPSEGVIQAIRDLRTSQSERKPVAPQWPSIDQITNHVRTQLERDLRIERERRGL